ncbi:MAG TPA: bifunctional DNA-formamidopyrimidine glycosylase/DNA-(apurinic or apyrimidinic site) lyase [Anaerolineales bacterium]|nr:bifunctional DNA-formamidopyrimidine glycosylase/DNA-(apurinic or apyrimidinic site) lyase [Anaerolineales bacterium]
MPELPEVETITNNLRPIITNRQIIACVVNWDRTIAFPLAQQFQAQIVNQKVQALSRRGKFIQIKLTQDFLLVHLRMSGDLLVHPSSYQVTKHDQVLFYLDDNTILVFHDTRKFGKIWLTEDPAKLLAKLGPEPFSEQLTPQAFHTLLQSKKRQLKPLLLDQSFLAGMGNIYTDEALFGAHLSPLTNSADISLTQAGLLLASIRDVLSEGIKNNGATIDWVYRGGKFQNHFKVYQRTGMPCVKCGTPIKKISLGQRGTHFCPSCQAITGE